MLKITRDHSIYEVWCEYTAESVFVDHKPTKEELEYIRLKEWPDVDLLNMPFKLKVFKLTRFYSSPKCIKCSGNGEYSYSSDLRVKCNECNGTGRVLK